MNWKPYVQTSTWLLNVINQWFINVTGFWKTDQIVTLGLLHFTGPTNGYTHTLHIHSASIRLG